MIVGQKGIDLCVGDRIRYRSASMIHPEAIYDGVVTEIHPTYYRVLGTPDRNTINVKDKKEFWGEATPYYFCIPRYLDETMDRVKVVGSEAEKLSA